VKMARPPENYPKIGSVVALSNKGPEFSCGSNDVRNFSKQPRQKLKGKRKEKNGIARKLIK